MSATLDGRAAEALPCCGVYALAYLLDKPFPEVFEAARTLKGKNKGWGGRTTHKDRAAVAALYGARLVLVSVRRQTLLNFVKRSAAPGVAYVVRTGGHIQVVKDGIVTDQRCVKHVTGYPGARKFATHAWTLATAA